VTRIVPRGEHDEIELLQRAAALESRSDHPLAQAIVSEAERRGVPFSPALDVQAIPGKGMTGWMDGKSYWIGSHRYLEECDRETPVLHEMLSAMSDEGRSTVVVGTDSHVCGIICLEDAIRPDAARAVQEMRDQGVEHIVILTGDNEHTARAVARETGIDEVRADLLPEDKVEAVEDLVRRYGQVAMVGDGINDAPAMVRATLGIAMGAAGSDVAVETADVALMADDLSRVPWLIAKARRTLATIHWNIGLALSVKLLFVVLTMAGHASLWAAIAADTGASLLVTFNGLRLLKQ
ncbi:MAG: HAD-IC family P-type ATPase, partial [Deltaproteobacteria bacterium]|nr:HAD-IC family P-type ATPase [Deltaproteobacteria bacterium]